ncbi:uncharacterized protein LOC129565509 isoform X2 [Sitodiplosis mosellana]|uniref:uncharacterized protein LOC129565509 isoform X2 n=1 Tax=Sitodiplosis mosellana TaxID=263140 RepID=UPI00244528E4|nr:uncharacterized protein LOC129565509 isoform X2 [Sitodiplosis mosellana]
MHTQFYRGSVVRRSYEAKATGNVQMVTNQFTQSILDANNKLNMLVNPADEVVAMVTNLYNSNCTNTPATAQAPNANPFGMGSNTMNSMNSGGSFFGGGNNAAQSNSLFGSSSSAASSNPFARNAAGFGGAQNQNTNLFGGSAATSNNMNLFGGGGGASGVSTATTGNSLFGGSSFSNTNNASAFGSTTQPNSLFGGGSTSGPFSQQNTNASPFAMPQSTNQSSGLFGAQAQSNPVFGGSASFGIQGKTGLFGQASASLGQANTGNIFGQSVQAPAFGAPQPQQQTNLFGNANQNQPQSLFVGQQKTMQAADNPFAAVAQSSNTNIFGQSQMQQQQPSPFQNSASVFGGNQNTNNFGGNASMVFSGAAQAVPHQNPLLPTPTQPPSLQQQQQNIFGANSFSAQPTAPAQTPFGGAGGNAFQSAQPQQQPPIQPLFGAPAQQQQNIFGAVGATAQQPAQQSKTLYTPMDSLSQEEIEAFNSNTFDISKIPTKPPPMELCI